MNSLKEKFENYSVQPDEKVWSSIEEGLHQHTAATARRRIAIGVSAIVIGTAVAVAVISGTSKEGQNDTITASNNRASTVLALDKDVSPVRPTEAETEAVVPQTNAAPSVVDEQPSAMPALTNVASEQAVNIENASTIHQAPAKNENVKATVPAAQPSTPIQPSAAETETVQDVEPEITVQPDNETKQNKMATNNDKTINDDLVVWIPNAFAPDDPNDAIRTFKVKANNDANIVSFEIFIYSRGGRQVYHSKDINAGWDGTAKGQAQPMGTYVYLIEINDAVKGLQHKKGTVTLIR